MPTGTTTTGSDSAPTNLPAGQSTWQSFEVSSLMPTGAKTTGPDSAATNLPEEHSTWQSFEQSSLVPTGTTTTDSSPTNFPAQQSTWESIEQSSLVPTGTTTTGPDSEPTNLAEEQSTWQSFEQSSLFPTGTKTSASDTKLESIRSPSTLEKMPDSQITTEDDIQYICINVRIISEMELEETTAKRIAVETVQRMVNKQAGTETKLELENVHCSADNNPEA
ncbi:uncharacterized protein LOC132207438 isoform X2 [Stegostoma tigrinum]|uniref:uncharacterized protein LOC132207438 isoform X2 n=1 Tax=Stegostoma tigrinum TaxID=3053191 RepID=UPI0028702DC5|nr:uncharacterized protein LOC132207438 isoform X2 [Stegostoma tigrinum]